MLLFGLFVVTDKMSRDMRIFAHAKTKTQISCAATAQLFSDFVLLGQFLNFKLLAICCNCIGRYVSDLVGNPEFLT